jgi:serpin B
VLPGIQQQCHGKTKHKNQIFFHFIPSSLATPQRLQQLTTFSMAHTLHESIQAFGSDLFTKIATSSGSNVCFSPYNIATCFIMLLEGADGNTRKQLMDAFKLPTNYQSQFKEHSKAIKNSESTVKLSNSLWASNKIALDDDYVWHVKRSVKSARINNVDFGQVNTADKINSYIDKKTGGLIRDVVRALDINTILVLVSVLYFKGTWFKPFEAHSTAPKTFYLLNNTSNIQVPMMKHLEERFEFTKHPTFSAISLPFKGRDTSMIFILPKENTKEELDRLSSAAFLTEFFTNKFDWMRSQLVDVTIPKFAFECDFDLKTLLPSLGVTEVFSPEANLSKLTKSKVPAYVNSAIHKTFIEVDEDGVKAAAATAVRVDMLGISKPKKTEVFNADHPFVFVLFQQVTQQPLFFGRVTDPSNGAKSSEKKRPASPSLDEEFMNAKKKHKSGKL